MAAEREASMTGTNRLKERAAVASIAVSALMTAAKFAAGLASGSLAVLSEAGHNLADVATTGLTYLAILIEAIKRLAGNDTIIEANSFVFGVLIVSIIVDLVRWRSLIRIAATTKSDALAADALHYSSDIVSSALALCGIAAVGYGYPQGDALAALGLALFIAVAGFQIGRRTVNTLVDTAPKGLASQIRSLAQTVPGVVNVETLRLRPAGAEIFGDI